MNELLKSNNDGNILLRIFYFPVIQILVAIIFINISTYILRNITQYLLSSLSINGETVNSIIVFIVRMASVYFSYNIFVMVFEKRKAHEISLNIASLQLFIYGAFIGIISIILVMFCIWLTGNFSILGINSSATVFESFIYHTFFAFLQDIIYFAIIFRILENWVGSWIAIIVASFIFGFKHLLFPGYTLWSVIAQTFEAGILFCSFYMLTKNIWLILGFHVFWNFIEYGLLLGFEEGNFIPLFISEFSGSSYITGMPVGIEASIFAFIILTSIGIYLMLKIHNRGRMILPIWKRDRVIYKKQKKRNES